APARPSGAYYRPSSSCRSSRPHAPSQWYARICRPSRFPDLQTRVRRDRAPVSAWCWRPSAAQIKGGCGRRGDGCGFCSPFLELRFSFRRPIGAVGPHLVAGVGLVQDLIKLLAVVNGRVGLGIAPNLEHHHRIERLAAGVTLPLLGRGPDYRLDVRAEALEGNDRVKRFERIPLGTDRLKTFVEIEKARLPHDVPPRCPRSRDT